MKEKVLKLNIRVYGLLINEKNEVLLTDEYRFGQRMTKFPGGGLVPGEGPAECLMREAIEEFEQEIEIIDHFYTTHFFQKALFFDDQQLISIYYLIRFKKKISFKISDIPFDFTNEEEGIQSFRFKDIGLLADELSFPVDRYVAQMLKEKYLSGC
jgi:8-oxo-dGTP diphosphatase